MLEYVDKCAEEWEELLEETLEEIEKLGDKAPISLYEENLMALKALKTIAEIKHFSAHPTNALHPAPYTHNVNAVR